MKELLFPILFLNSLALTAAIPLSGRIAPGLTLLARSDFNNGRAEGWKPNDPEHWRVVEKDGAMVYELTSPAAGPGKVRAPRSWSLWTGHETSSFEFTGRMLCAADTANPMRDMCVFFHFQDPTHFCYVHFAGSSDEAHNIIGLVNGADRVKINREPAGASVFRMTDTAWHEFKVTCNAVTGEIRAYLDDMTTPVLTARDRTLGHGLVGIGSFDDTGCFDDLALRGEDGGRTFLSAFNGDVAPTAVKKTGAS